MFQPGTDWNPLQARLKEIIMKKDDFKEAKELLIRMHSLVHTAEVYHNTVPTFMDEVWDGLEGDSFRAMPTVKDDTAAWDIWHITRIEDLTTNLLIRDQDQILTEDWLQHMEVTVRDTGNAMTDDEIISLSNSIRREGLYQYRKAVGKRTKEIIEGLSQEDMKRKVSRQGLERIRIEGGVTEHADSIWLLEFWGRKNIAGILQMPVTRHQIVHLNDCRRLKSVIEKRAKK